MFLSTTSIFGFSTASTEAARFNGSQYFLIGYTTSNGAYRLQVNSQIFATNATIATSDANYKKNVSLITNGLEIINKLKPVSFDWKEHPVHNFSDGTDIGFLAQDVQEILSEEKYAKNVVKNNNCTYKDSNQNEITEPFLGLSDTKLIPILTSAVQQLSNKVSLLEDENKNLYSIINNLSQRLEKLEK